MNHRLQLFSWPQKATMLVTMMAVILAITCLLLTNPTSATTPRPVDTLKNLEEGNQFFIKQRMTHPRQSKARRTELASGQQPPAIILACSDSRVPPEIILDQGLGDLFVVRVAGNILNKDNLASIEFAIVNFGSNLIMVMGHQSCGAVGAALNTPKGKNAGSPSLNVLVKTIRHNVTLGGRSLPASPFKGDLDPFVIANVHGVVKQLKKQSKIIFDHLKEGKITIIPAIYSLDTGAVRLLTYPHKDTGQ